MIYSVLDMRYEKVINGNHLADLSMMSNDLQDAQMPLQHNFLRKLLSVKKCHLGSS